VGKGKGGYLINLLVNLPLAHPRRFAIAQASAGGNRTTYNYQISDV